MTDYFISDVHFGHKNCLAFDNRPFMDIESHDNVLVNNWNNTVNIDDHIYILGDVSYHNVTKTVDIINGLNGNKTLIIGNHDRKFLKNKQFRECFIEISNYKEVDIGNGKKLILCHYPLASFDGQFRHNIHLYGHVHNSDQFRLTEYLKRTTEDLRGDGTCRMYNVGAMLDYIDYTPRTLEEILETCEGEDSKSVLERNLRDN